MVAPTLSSRGISKSFSSGRIVQHVIKGSSLEVFPGELTLIVGPSGSGKSTMLSMLSGLLRPDAGKVCVLGHDLWALDERRLDRFRLEHCGFVFQGYNLFASLTALDNVILPLQYLGVYGKDARARQKPWARSASTGTATCGPPSCPVARSSAWRSRGLWSSGPNSCSPTSPRRRWTRATARSS